MKQLDKMIERIRLETLGYSPSTGYYKAINKVLQIIDEYNVGVEQSEVCDGCKHFGKWEPEVEYGYSSPCIQCKRRAEDNYEVGGGRMIIGEQYEVQIKISLYEKGVELPIDKVQEPLDKLTNEICSMLNDKLMLRRIYEILDSIKQKEMYNNSSC